MFKVAVQSAVLSIRQGGEFQYLALVTRTLNSIGQIQCLYHGTDAANLTLLGKPPGILVDGLKTYKRGLVAVHGHMPGIAADCDTWTNVCNVMTTSIVLAELGARIEAATTTLVSHTLLSSVKSSNCRDAKALSHLLRANSLLAFLHYLSRCHSDTISSHLLQKILKPVVIAVYERLTPRNTLYATTIPTSLFIIPDVPLSQHVPAPTFLSAQDGVASFTLYHHTTVPIAATEPLTKPMEAFLQMKILPPRHARLLLLHLRTVLGKRKRQNRDGDEDTNVPAASLVAMENIDPVAMKENVDPASGRSLSMIPFHAR